MSKEKPYSDDRWNFIPACEVIGHTNTSYENELSGLQEVMKSGLFDEEWFQKELKIIKKRYGIKE
jgi:hypothetical protein